MAEIPRGIKGPYRPICRDCAMYFSISRINEVILPTSISQEVATWLGSLG